jgi:hypothetical protein
MGGFITQGVRRCVDGLECLAQSTRSLLAAAIDTTALAHAMVRPVMRRFTSTQSRLFASLLTVALVTAPLHVVEAAPSVEDLYTQGQEKFDAGDYGSAGDLWAEAVRALPENPDNSATRQTIMNLALDAYVRAYRADESRSHVDKAKALLDEYEAALEAAGGALGSEIASEKAKVEDILAELAAAEKPEDEPEDEPDPDPVDEGPVMVNDKPGQGLVIGGAVMLGVGAAGLGLMIGGLVGGGSAQKAFEASTPGPDRESVRKRGQTMNILAITGGVVGGVFLGAGVALLIIGLQRNKAARLQNVMVLPEVGPEYAGFGLSGRF